MFPALFNLDTGGPKVRGQDSQIAGQDIWLFRPGLLFRGSLWRDIVEGIEQISCSAGSSRGFYASHQQLNKRPDDCSLNCGRVRLGPVHRVSL